jgi:lycopene beta-cyclase
MVDVDYALVGGGLQAGLIALAVRAAQPRARIAIVERGPALGGNHTWCFHAGDVSAEAAWIEPLIAVRWPGYDVAFPGRARTLDSAYAAIPSARLAEVVPAAVDELALDTTALAIGADRVETTRAGRRSSMGRDRAGRCSSARRSGRRATRWRGRS